MLCGFAQEPVTPSSEPTRAMLLAKSPTACCVAVHSGPHMLCTPTTALPGPKEPCLLAAVTGAIAVSALLTALLCHTARGVHHSSCP